MFKGRISRVFDLEAEERGSSASALESSDRLCVPTLDERAKLYLRAVHGKRDFTNQEYSDARNLILDAMAADFAAKSEIHLPDEPREAPIHIPEAALIAALASLPGLAEPNKRFSTPTARRLTKRSIFIYAGVIAASVMALVLVGPLLMVWFAPDSKLQTTLLESSPDRGSKGDFAVTEIPPLVARTVKSAGEPDAGDQHVQTQAAVETAPTVIDQPDREAIADLLKRGQELIAAGKISEGRVALNAAAERGSAPAALALGETYDPTIPQEHKAPVQKQMLPMTSVVARTDPVGSAATDPVTDIAMARAWYEKARDLGSAEASVRLKKLADHASRQSR
jgi:hypothetical protein